MNHEKDYDIIPGLDRAKLGSRVRAKRTSLGRSQEWLAEQINTSVETVKNIEKAKRGTSLNKLVVLAKALETTPDYLLDFDENETHKEPLSEQLKNIIDFLRGCTPAELESIEKLIVLYMHDTRKK